ncbi:hypothetical protein D9M72_638430 [compost metagenome]
MQLDLDPQLLGQGLGEFHLKAGHLAVGIDEAERWIGAFKADVDHALVLDLLQLLASHSLAEQAGPEQQAKAGGYCLFTESGNLHG